MPISFAGKILTVFDVTAEQASSTQSPRVPLRYAIEFMLDGETPGRVLNDECMRIMLPCLRGPETIVELGGSGDYYKNFVPGQKFEVTNYEAPCDRIVDMTKMPFESGSIAAFVSMFALEHVYDFHAVIRECLRCLKPGGRLLLAVPFLYYYHGAPDDYFRFTDSALDRMLSGFTVLKKVSLGNRGLLLCQLFHEKRILGSTHGWLLRFMFRAFCLIPLLTGLLGNQRDRRYAITHLYLVQKP